MATRSCRAASKYKRKQCVTIENDLYCAMIDALYFYADIGHNTLPSWGYKKKTPVMVDGGKLARNVLRKQGAIHF